MKKTALPLLVFAFISNVILAQVAKDQALRLQAVANPNGSITISWPINNLAGSYSIYKRSNPLSNNWGSPIAGLDGNENSYTDVNVKKGEAFEYHIAKHLGSTTIALGYIFAGNAWPEPKQFDGIILLIDSHYRIPLQAEIAQLNTDLTKESYWVHQMFAGRNETPANVKKRLEEYYNAANIKPACLFIIGHVPVPYAGYFSANGAAPPPDGHVEGSGNHTGAWPADVYYGIFDGEFTDYMVNITTGAQARNHNVPDDGKFDQTKLSANAVLEVGRVDLFNMPAFGKSDTVLTENYLQRNHAWRTGQWTITERALIDNNFTGLNLASTGYANFAAIIGSDSTFDNRDYFTAQKSGGYLWSYGCGAGSYTSCSGIGNTNSFVNDSFENVFTILAGSFFGDWDVQNNFLRAPLASKSLASFWGGIPKWYVHHMALGERIGKGTKITQNNNGFYFTGNFNSSANSMHIALMGDPTLTIRNLPAVQNLQAISENKQVKLYWNSAGLNQQYAVYIVDTLNNIYNRLNEQIITDTFYTDANNHYSGNYLYAVKPIRLETTASGSFYKVGGAAFARVNHVNSLLDRLENSFAFTVYPNPLSANNSLHIHCYQNEKADMQFQLFDMQGRQVWFSQNQYLSSGKQDIVVEKMPVPAGVYFLQVQANNVKAVQKLIIVN
ncbi:MAG: T9SS type A sorting domain-containing protein [Bacteroidota bacterium]|nr:T9SS type A sorting domain-containing protein [Bacteroidota bacterium]